MRDCAYLGLEEVGGQALGAVAVVEVEAGGEARGGDADACGGGDDVAPRILQRKECGGGPKGIMSLGFDVRSDRAISFGLEAS